MKELFERFERQAIDANYSISFSKTDGNTKYFYTRTQSVFDGWLLHYRHSNGVDNNVINPATRRERLVRWWESTKKALGGSVQEPEKSAADSPATPQPERKRPC